MSEVSKPHWTPEDERALNNELPSKPQNSLRCQTYLPGGWCRNKVVIQAPNGAGGMKNLCRRHADQYAHEIVMKNHALYWALAWQGNISNA